MGIKQLKLKTWIVVAVVLLAPIVLWGPTLLAGSSPAPATSPAATPASANSAPAPDAGTSSGQTFFLKDYQLSAEEPAPVSVGSTLTDVFFKLIVVLGLIFLATKGLQKLNGAGRPGIGPSAGRIDVLEATHLAPNRSLYLVEVGGKVVLVGSTPNQFTSITEITDPAVVDQLRTAHTTAGQSATPGIATFQQYLSTLLGSKSGVGTLSGEQENQISTKDVNEQAQEGRQFLQEKITDLQRLAAGFRKS